MASNAAETWPFHDPKTRLETPRNTLLCLSECFQMPQKLADIQSGPMADLLVILLKSHVLSCGCASRLVQHPARQIVRDSR
jgi:hypothetical protein